MRVTAAPAVERLVGVYDTDGTILGELSYFLQARLGRAHCALCDVTHGRRERDDWRVVFNAPQCSDVGRIGTPVRSGETTCPKWLPSP